MTAKSALIVGATGLTGGHLLNLLLESADYHTVTALVRTPTGIRHGKLQEKLIDYERWQESVPADDVFCCLGTTIKKAKTKTAFRKVDLDYPVKIANLQYEGGSQHFLVISSMGASPRSAIFYSRVKGEMEEKLRQIGYPSLSIFRPSLITGNRKEPRLGERIALSLSGILSLFLIGPLKKYKPVAALVIAQSMFKAAQANAPGSRVILSDEIIGNT